MVNTACKFFIGIKPFLKFLIKFLLLKNK